jgi:hypothetical protein
MYHCYFLINYIGPPKVFFSFPLAPSLKSLPITALGEQKTGAQSIVKEINTVPGKVATTRTEDGQK